ncbi:hypothetical protein GGX14DRAFT_395987 [Mycena pura]|uniref:Uncharacterized protein n=1 Tax=Mycena pura TaxID=153505 RepID=A0AAD6VFN4_9AGAR|nr:hypothetical protein GGX14DRAFT_395987 [Mycena pura]
MRRCRRWPTPCSSWARLALLWARCRSIQPRCQCRTATLRRRCHRARGRRSGCAAGPGSVVDAVPRAPTAAVTAAAAGQVGTVQPVQLMGTVVRSSEPTQAVVREKNVRSVVRISPWNALGRLRRLRARAGVCGTTSGVCARRHRRDGRTVEAQHRAYSIWCLCWSDSPHNDSAAATTAPPPSNGDSDEQGVVKAGSPLDEDTVRAAGEEAADGNVDKTLSFEGRACRVCYVGAREAREGDGLVLDSVLSTVSENRQFQIVGNILFKRDTK